MNRIGGSRRKTKHKMSKNVSDKGKISIRRLLNKFSEGDRVCFCAEPAYQKGLYNLRFHGKVGTVKGTRGKCYEIQFKDFNKTKLAIVHPLHLKKVK